MGSSVTFKGWLNSWGSSWGSTSSDPTGSATVSLTATGSLSGTGTLSGNATLNLGTSGTLVAVGTLEGSATATLSASATGSLTGVLSGSASLSLNATGDLTTSGSAIEGSAALGISVNATASAIGLLEGLASLAFTATADLTSGTAVPTDMVGSATFAISGEGTLLDRTTERKLEAARAYAERQRLPPREVFEEPATVTLPSIRLEVTVGDLLAGGAATISFSSKPTGLKPTSYQAFGYASANLVGFRLESTTGSFKVKGKHDLTEAEVLAIIMALVSETA